MDTPPKHIQMFTNIHDVLPICSGLALDLLLIKFYQILLEPVR